MQPNQNVAGTPNQNTTDGSATTSAAGASFGSTPAPTTAPTASTAPEQNIMAQGGEKKKGKGMVYALILFVIIAICGVGFGVWAMMDGNSQKDQLNSQIKSLKQQNSELSEQVSDLQARLEELEGTKTNGGGEGSGQSTLEWGTAKAQVINGAFSIVDENDEIVVQDDSVEVVEIVSCDTGTAADKSPLTCNVTTKNGQAKYTYNYEDGSLTYTDTTE